MTEWISIKDEQPEEGKEVLVCDSLSYGKIDIAVFYNGTFHTRDLDENDKELYPVYFDFWMPLPEPITNTSFCAVCGMPILCPCEHIIEISREGDKIIRMDYHTNCAEKFIFNEGEQNDFR